IADRVARFRWVRRPLHVGPVLTLIALGGGIYAMGLPGAFLGLVAVALLAAAIDPDTSDLAGVVETLVDDPMPGGAERPDHRPAVVEDGGDGPVLRVRLSRRTAAAAGALVVGFAAVLQLVDAA